MKNLTAALTLMILSLTSVAVAPTVSNFLPVSAVTGMTVVINGANFTGATAVSFGGVAATSFTVNSSTQITAVVGSGNSGAVQVTTIDGPGSKAGFGFVLTSGIITDFGGYWVATGANPNAVAPDSSHNLLAFTFNGTTYSTGVNNTILNNKGVVYTDGTYKALPVAGIAGVNGATSTFLALAKKVDGSALTGNVPAVANYNLRTALTDGPNGLNLGTGVTNLPTSAILTFPIFNINAAAISDDVPDIILTQIAQPVTGNDAFSFLDASGLQIGNSITQDMTLLPRFGDYSLDLFNLTPNTPYNSAVAYSIFTLATSREIRLVAFRLSDFGITAGMAAQVKALRITPSGTSDYAFIAYNASAINMPPNVSQNDVATNQTICSGGTANLAVLAAPAGGGALSYLWEESVDGGSTWTTVSNGGSYSGAATARLAVSVATNGYKYRATVAETGNVNTGSSSVFTIVVSAPTAPSAVGIAGGTSTCLNNAVQLTSNVTGGTNLLYQWQSNTGGPFTDIPGAMLNTYSPSTGQTGVTGYRLNVSAGSGCGAGVTSSTTNVTVTGIASTLPAAVCASGALSLSATATSGVIDWYDAHAAGTLVTTGNNYTTPVLSSSKTYYLASSGCASALRVPLTATVYPASNGGSITGSATVPPGVNSTTLQVTGNTGAITKWQSSTDAFATTINDIANPANQLTVTNLSQTTNYRAVAQSGTCAVDFSLSGTITVSAALPVDNKSVRATRQNNAALIQWTAYNQQNTERYEIEKSTDAVHFTFVAALPATLVNALSVNYSWLDMLPANGNNYYRIREILLSGAGEYSSVVSLMFANTAASVSVWPNPVKESTLNIRLQHMAPGNYRFTLTNTIGQTVMTAKRYYDGVTNYLPVKLPAGIDAGKYILQAAGPAGTTKTSKVLLMPQR